jgi:hypothetical protein
MDTKLTVAIAIQNKGMNPYAKASEKKRESPTVISLTAKRAIINSIKPFLALVIP